MHQKQKLIFNKPSQIGLLIQLVRPHTLPLAISGVLCANALSYAWGGRFSFLIGFLSLLTAVFLQILSNLANDFGDMVKGADTYRDTHAPKRLVQQGKISKATLKILLFLMLVLSLISGFWLLLISDLTLMQWLIFLTLGILSLIGAITYTVGKYAYGYIALGEVAVFLFFGVIAVIGNFYLQTKLFDVLLLLPASGLGLLCAGVLHINNIRDIASDKKAGKITIANLLGLQKAKFLHYIFVIYGVFAYLLFIILTKFWGGLLVCFALPQLFKHLYTLSQTTTPIQIGQELKNAVMFTWWVNFYFAVGVLIDAL